MDMSQVGREHRQALFDIDTGSVPIKKRGHRKSMAKIMNAWTTAIPDFPKTDLAGELNESPSDHTVSKRYALIRQEEVGCGGSRPKLIETPKILLEVLHS
ncbi:MAG: hypothetical protein ACWGP1_11675 [Syntrophobacteria bacterium]